MPIPLMERLAPAFSETVSCLTTRDNYFIVSKSLVSIVVFAELCISGNPRHRVLCDDSGSCAQDLDDVYPISPWAQYFSPVDRLDIRKNEKDKE